MNATTIIEKEFTTNLNITEDLLPFVRITMLGKTIGQKNNFTTYGLNYIPDFDNNDTPEFDYLLFNQGFLKLKSGQYKFFCKITIYVQQERQSDNSFNGNPIELKLILSYLNKKGQYEVQKYQV